MGRDNAPIGNTCPMIDDIINRLNSAKNELDYIFKYPEQDSTSEADTIRDELFSAISEMEDIRSANAELREWGNEQHDLREEQENLVNDLQNEVEYLKDELQGLKDELESVEGQRNELYAENYYLKQNKQIC